jgi:hypothetical protein
MIDSSTLLSGIPATLRDPLLVSYEEILRNYTERRWEPAELNGGKFCEVVYSIVSGNLNGRYAGRPSKPRDMVAACRRLENISADPSRSGDRSRRVLIPRVLQALYEIRNNRGVGHVGGDVDPNFLDATAVYSMASWVLAELVRIFHAVSITQAQEAVDTLIERKHSLIWEFENVKRVLDPRMSKSDQMLLLLHAKPSWVLEKDIVRWIEYSNAKVMRDNIVRPLHKERFVEYDEKQRRLRISPLGASYVESNLLQSRP